MPKYTTPEVVESNLRQSWDEQYYQLVRHQIRFTLGEPMSSGSYSAPSVSGEFPDDPDILPRYYEPGQSRRILTNQALMMAKVCYMDPSPEYPDKPEWPGLVTQGLNKVLWRGRPYMGPAKYAEFGEWAPECYRAFMDGDGLGTGWVQIGHRDGWLTIQHHPLGRVIWDSHRFGTTRARFVAFIHHLPVEEAVDMFGSDVEKEAGPDQISTVRGEQRRVIKALQWFDMGLGKSEPTEMWRLKSMNGKVLDIGPNEFDCLPAAHYEHMHLFGMRRATGRVDFQIADQELRNAYERYQRLILIRGPGFDMVDPTGIDPDTLDAWKSGELLTFILKQLPPGMKMQDTIHRERAHEIPNTLLEGLQYLDRMDPGNSGISEGDRANVTAGSRTLGELNLVQAGADTQKQWSLRQYAAFQARLWYKVNWIAAKLQTAPTPITVNGIPQLFNDPQEPRSDLSYWLSPHTWPVVNEDTFLWMDPLRKAQIAQGKWMPLLQDPYSNPIEVRKELLKGYGIKDPDRFLNPQAMIAAQGGTSGAPTDAVAGMGQTSALPAGAAGGV